jgi:ribosome-associated heat shock protein Hsp15
VTESADDSAARLRLDKWLWYARFFKTRSLAARACAAGRMRINREVVSKSHATVKPGDVVTFPLGPLIRVIEIIALGMRRGPASEAQALYNDLAPRLPPVPGERPKRPASVAARDQGAGRPTKADHRAIMRLKEGDT